LPDTCARAIFLSSKCLLVIMAQFLRNEKDTEEIILGRDTEKSMSCK
jgi:hypothetical protein